MPRTRRAPDTAAAADDSLKRLGGGRWQTRDERFTIEPQSGTWVVVDAEQTDELGMALVRGPFRSLGEAKAAIGAARAGGPAASPLAGRPRRGGNEAAPRPPVARPAKAATRAPRAAGKTAPATAEPSWLADLGPADRGRARRLIETLEQDSVADAESIVRRDVAGGVPALAALAIGRRLATLDPDATREDIAAALADGRDEGLDVRWRLVDGDGRPIVLDTRRRGSSRAAKGGR